MGLFDSVTKMATKELEKQTKELEKQIKDKGCKEIEKKARDELKKRFKI